MKVSHESIQKILSSCPCEVNGQKCINYYRCKNAGKVVGLMDLKSPIISSGTEINVECFHQVSELL